MGRGKVDDYLCQANGFSGIFTAGITNDSTMAFPGDSLYIVFPRLFHPESQFLDLVFPVPHQSASVVPG